MLVPAAKRKKNHRHLSTPRNDEFSRYESPRFFASSVDRVRTCRRPRTGALAYMRYGQELRRKRDD
jgi:hypothetical protein